VRRLFCGSSRDAGDADGVGSRTSRVPVISGSRCGRLGLSGAEPSVPTLAAQTVLRARSGRPLRGPCIYLACGRSLVRNSPRGWAPKTLPDPEARVGRAKARQHRRQARRHGREGRDRQPGTSHRFGIDPVFRERPRPTTAPRNGSPSLSRIVVRDLGVHPRGEFRTSGAAVGQISTWAALAAFPFRTRRTCLSSEGGHQGLPRETPKCRERRRSRAREAEGEPCARCEVRGAKESPV
jgi:hypothetical protein